MATERKDRRHERKDRRHSRWFRWSRRIATWGMLESLRDHRTLLLSCAFGLNLIAIACILVAATAMTNSATLTSVAWASATATISHLPDCIFNNNSDNNTPNYSASLTVQVWLGLKGYYGQCHAQLWRLELPPEISTAATKSESTSIHPHSDTFCSTDEEQEAANNLSGDDDPPSSLANAEASCPDIAAPSVQCELFTTVMDLDYLDYAVIDDGYIDSGDNKDRRRRRPRNRHHFSLSSCTACKDTSRDCVGTLLSAGVFGVFPLLLTLRRLCGWTQFESNLRLRTLFFSALALILGLHAFMRFHVQCLIRNMPQAFGARVVYCDGTMTTAMATCDNTLGNDGDDNNGVWVELPSLDLQLYTGGKLVMVAAALKFSYFTLHLVTPLARPRFLDGNDDRDAYTMGGERQRLLTPAQPPPQGPTGMNDQDNVDINNCDGIHEDDAFTTRINSSNRP